MSRYRDPQLQVAENCSYLFNPLSPHDALKHHCKSMKIDLIFQQLGFWNEYFHESGLPIHGTSNQLHPLQVENCDSNSRLVVDEDDNGKFRLERVNLSKYLCLDTHFIPNNSDWVDVKYRLKATIVVISRIRVIMWTHDADYVYTPGLSTSISFPGSDNSLNQDNPRQLDVCYNILLVKVQNLVW